MDSRLLDVSATESVRAIREGRVSCEAVVDAHLSRLEEVRCDVVLSPAWPHPAPRHGDVHPHDFDFTLAYSLAGWPAAVVPVAADSQGLPIGVQVAAAPWRDDLALAAAIAIEMHPDDRSVSG